MQIEAELSHFATSYNSDRNISNFANFLLEKFKN